MADPSTTFEASALPMPCLRCGYDLRATPADSPCPECGLAAHRSVGPRVHPDDCPPRWVRSIAIATLLLLVSYLAFLLSLAFLIIVGPFYPDLINPAVLYIVMAAIAALHLRANILLSRDDPRRRPFSWASTLLRWSLRIVPLCPVAALAVIFFANGA